MERGQLRVLLVGGALLLLIIGLLTPWWNVSLAMSSSSAWGGFDQSGDIQAGPFDDGGDPDEADDGIIEESQAMVAGLLVSLGLVAALAALVMDLVPQVPAKVRAAGPWVAIGAAGFALAAVLLAATTWGEDLAFWDQESSAANGFSASVTTAAAAGWYLTVLAAGLLGGAVVLHFTPTNNAADAPVAAEVGQCAATTKAGNPCSRKATNGPFCGTHA